MGYELCRRKYISQQYRNRQSKRRPRAIVPRYIHFIVANTRHIGYILCRAAPKSKRRQCRCSRKAKKLSMSRSLRRYRDFALFGLGRYRYRRQRKQNIVVSSTVLTSIILRHQSRKVESRQPTLRYRYSSYPL